MMEPRNVPHQAWKETILLILLSAALLAYETYLFEGPLLIAGYSFQVGALLVPLLLFKKYAMERECKVLFLLYVSFMVYALLVTVFSPNADTALLNAARLFTPLLMFFAWLHILHPKNVSLKIIQFPLVLGVIFAIQTIVLCVLLQLDSAPLGQWIQTARTGLVLDYGIWGYGTGTFAKGSIFEVYRAQSFFGEPSKLALFLEYGLFVSFGLFRTRKKMRYLIAFGLLLASFILTFSKAGFLAVITTVLIYGAYRVTRNVSSLERLPSRAVLILLAIAIAALGFTFSTYIYSNQEMNKAIMGFGASPVGIATRIKVLQDTLKLAARYPFGIGLVQHMQSDIMAAEGAETAASAPMIWLAQTGIFGLSVLCGILYYIYRQWLRHSIVKPNTINCYLALAFISQTLHHVIFGQWMGFTYLYTLALVIATRRWRFYGKRCDEWHGGT